MQGHRRYVAIVAGLIPESMKKCNLSEMCVEMTRVSAEICTPSPGNYVDLRLIW